MYRLQVKLKQHTPLIHFQWEQKGATLRASEVKPKLDRFLLEKLGGEKEWLIEGKKALDYKMKIIAKDKPIEQDRLPMYFGGKDKKGVWFAKGLELTIFSWNKSLLEEIENNLREFFICTNFGTRATKGFGSFEVLYKKGKDRYDEWKLDETKREECLKGNFDFVYKKTASPTLETIKEDYQEMKSGVNYNNNYTKSLLFCYAADENNKELEEWGEYPRWEKRKLKQKIRDFLNNEENRELGLRLKSSHDPVAHIDKDNSCWDDKDNSCWDDKDRKGKKLENGFKYWYLRALLGITKQYSFTLSGANACNYRLIVEVKSESGIERYASPLFFKVIDNIIYLVGKNESKILNKKFEFTIKLWEKENEKEKMKLKSQLASFTIGVPSKFVLSNFVKYAMAHLSERCLPYEELKSIEI